MAYLTNGTGSVKAGNGIGSKTTIIAVTTATVSVSDAIDTLSLTHTIVGVTGTSAGTEHVAVQGSETIPTIAGTATVCTFTD